MNQGFLRVVSPSELDQRDQADIQRRMDATRARASIPDIGHWIRQQWMVFRNHRNLGANPINQRLLRAQRMFESKYDPDKLQQIQAFGGSEVYSGTVATKARGATSLLRDIYLGPQRPWEIESTNDPPIPDDVRQAILHLIQVEVQTQAQAGQPVEQDQVHMRYVGLLHAAQQAARRNADMQAATVTDKLDEILIQGSFYQAMSEFLLDLPLFPYAVLKGPVVRMVPRLTWVNRRPNLQNQPTMFWERKSPFDIYWSPGASNIVSADIIERHRYTRSDLNDLLGLPGYDQDAVRAALDDYANGLREWLDAPDSEQAINEGRENPNLNYSKYIDGIEFHGCLQGEHLIDLGVDRKIIPDLYRDYMVQSWVVGRHTLKTAINPSPRMRHPYYVTSFEKIPGTIAGHSLPDILEDLQEVSNAAFRSLVNNLSISSGPQVIINDEMVSPTEHGDELYPWKRWHVQGDPMGNQRDPITFFQPQSNVQELLLVINSANTMADERSAIPRYLTGESLSGGAGRTSSGLAMLMNNAQKILQTVAANVDGDVLEPLLHALYDLAMLTDQSGILTGEETIRVLGSEVVIQRETQQQKQLQFLQITANPIDAPIIGQIGRARLLRSIAGGLGVPDDIVPDDQTLQAKQDAENRMQAAQQAVASHAQAAGIQPQVGPHAGGVQNQQGSQGGSASRQQGVGSPPGQPGASMGPGGGPAPPSGGPPPVNAFGG